tara:strand:- start:320 stop:955 length:636 start_codon:yes stop_codon:yes gene_type:complete
MKKFKDGVYYYRILTFCFDGDSDDFMSYLGSPSEKYGLSSSSDELVRDVFAKQLAYGPYADSRLPFCSTLLGWASSEYDISILSEMMSVLTDNLTVSTNEEKVTAEGFGINLEEGSMHLAGVYPLLDVDDDDERADEYKNVSFLLNNETRESLNNLFYGQFIKGLLESGKDKLGVMIAVIANTDKLAQSKADEFINYGQVFIDELEKKEIK